MTNTKLHLNQLLELATHLFICENERFLLWSIVIKLRYWIDLGSTEKYNVSWVKSRNKSGAILKSLIRVSMPDFQQSDNNCNDLFFALTLFKFQHKQENYDPGQPS